MMSITKVIPPPHYHGNVPILIVNIISSVSFWAFLPAQSLHKHCVLSGNWRAEC